MRCRTVPEGILNTLLRLLFVTLLASGVLSLFRLAPPEAPWPAPALVALVLYGPLLLAGLLAARLHPRSLIWFCILLMFYFCGFVVQCFAPPPAACWGLWHALLVVTLFGLALPVIRRGRHAS